MKKIIIGSISAIALVVITAFQKPEPLAPSTELVIEMPNIEKEIKEVPSHDYNSGSDGVFDFDDRM